MTIRGTLTENAANTEWTTDKDNRYTKQEPVKKEKEITCTACGARVPMGSKFCFSCGAPIVDMICTACGARVPVGSKFCFSCGAPILDNAKSRGVSKNESSRITVNPVSDQEKKNVVSHGFNERASLHNRVSSAGNSIAGVRKKLGIAVIILGFVIAVLGGAAAGTLSDSYQPLETRDAYRDPNTGELVIYDYGTIGGNSEAVSYYNSMKILFIVAGIIITCAGAGMYLSGKIYEETKSVKKRGQVIGLDSLGASIEFDDGSRVRMPYLAKVVLVNGDRGIFEMKENTIIGFQKQ